MHFSSVLTEEIESNLKIEALSMMQEIDWHVFERIQNIMIWKNLEVMQDIRVQDIDKRLAYFLREISQGYQGMYPFLLALDNKQQFIAASDMPFQRKLPNIEHTSWQTIKVSSQSIFIQTTVQESSFFALAVPIPDQFTSGNLGYLHTAVDWDSINRILESPLPFQQQDANSYSFVVDQNNQIIAASKVLRLSGLLHTQIPEQWDLVHTDKGVQQVTTPFLETDTWLLSWSTSTGHRSYSGLGWKVVVMIPLDHALEPVFDMWQILLVFIAFTTLLAAAVSFGTARRIAKPIIQLAQFTRDFRHDKKSKPPLIQDSGEIAELSEQFTLMINNLEKSQQDMVRMAKFAVIAEMAATMAHEIRTPLGILRSSAQMLSREKNLSPIAEEMVGFIESETTRLNDLVSSLLASSRPSHAQFAMYSLHAVITHAIELLAPQAEKKSIELILHDRCLQSNLAFDWDQMLQVFLNLIVNAIQHVDVGGFITIEMNATPDTLVIQVNDDGAGVPDSLKESIFEPFYTSRQEGIGLGLMVVQKIINTHHGDISISDSQSNGACFTITLPVNKEHIQ